MQYIILADGEGLRWNNSLGITKQEAKINGERILDRIIRLVKEKNDETILILSRNSNHENKDAIRIESKYEDYFHHKYAYDYLNQPTIYLYGDTYYTKEAIDVIIDTNIADITFFGNEGAIVALKAINFELLKFVLDNSNLEKKSLYRTFKNLEVEMSFVNIGDTFVNINNYKDYEFLKEKEEAFKSKKLN